MQCQLASNIIRSMSFSDNILTLHWAKYTKRYYNVPTEVGYGLAYNSNPLGYFNTNIKNKFKTIKL